VNLDVQFTAPDDEAWRVVIPEGVGGFLRGLNLSVTTWSHQTRNEVLRAHRTWGRFRAIPTSDAPYNVIEVYQP
jgi:hypothetical protein